MSEKAIPRYATGFFEYSALLGLYRGARSKPANDTRFTAASIIVLVIMIGVNVSVATTTAAIIIGSSTATVAASRLAAQRKRAASKV